MISSPQKLFKKLGEILQIFSVISLPFTIYFPQVITYCICYIYILNSIIFLNIKGVFMYWITSSSFSLIQILSFKNNSIRRMLNLPAIKEQHTILNENNVNNSIIRKSIETDLINIFKKFDIKILNNKQPNLNKISYLFNIILSYLQFY